MKVGVLVSPLIVMEIGFNSDVSNLIGHREVGEKALRSDLKSN